jgi:N-acetylmuramoyl-L-alanine amidase
MAKPDMTAPQRARESFERNMSRQEQQGPEPRPTIGDVLKSRLGWLIASVTALVAGVSAFTANLDTLSSRAKTYWEERAYLSTLQNPYPALLDRSTIADWRSGEVQLALFQIDGYHGALKTAPSWVKMCLTNSEMFPGLADHQFNDRSELPESYIDQRNKQILRQRMDQIDNEQREDAATLRINDPFTKLLTRSRYQLLSKYKDSELPQLDKAELYLLRNAIYARHNYPFNTAKLLKFANRMGWTRPEASLKPLSKIEACNAFFLQQLHPNQELGSLGRGVLIKDSVSGDLSNYVKPAICACLGQPSRHIDCQRNPGSSDRTDFHDFVDLIIELEPGPANKIEWTFLDEPEIVGADLDTFKNHEEKFYASALDFNVAIQAAFRSAGQDLVTSSESKRGPYWGLRLTLSPEALSALTRTPAFSSGMAQNVCDSVHRAFETAGPFIPRTVAPPFRPDPNNPVLEINDKPIVFEDLRTKLTQEYVKKHYDIPLKQINFTPEMLIVHRSKIGDLGDLYESVRMSILPGTQEFDDDENADVNMSMHYVIDRDGAIYSLMKDFQIARHSIGLDRRAIGITLVGAGAGVLPDKQVIAAATLARYLKGKYASLQWLVSDAETASFESSPLWEEKLPFVRDPDADPGAAYMTRLRSFVADLSFKSAP